MLLTETVQKQRCTYHQLQFSLEKWIKIHGAISVAIATDFLKEDETDLIWMLSVLEDMLISANVVDYEDLKSTRDIMDNPLKLVRKKKSFRKWLKKRLS